MVHYYFQFTCCHLVTSVERKIYVFYSYVDITKLYLYAKPHDATAMNSRTTCPLAIKKWTSNYLNELNKVTVKRGQH